MNDQEKANQCTLQLSGNDFGALAKSLIEDVGSVRLVANGGSMYPSIESGDFLTVARVPFSELSIGDVIAFQPTEESKIVIHRIIDLSEDSFKSQGDSKLRVDGSFPTDAILGKVIQVEKRE